MKQENGKGMIKALFLFVIMIVIILWICMSIFKNIKTQKEDDVVSNMMLIKGACKVFNENRIRNTKEEEILIGTKLSDIGKQEEKSNDENTEGKENEVTETNNQSDKTDESKEEKKLKEIIEEFKTIQAIPEEEYEKYYVLTDKNLEELKVDVKNEANSYYLINYEMNEVIITKGYEGKYKLSEIEEARANAKNNEENNDDIEEKNEGNDKDNSEEKNEEEKQEEE